MLRKRFKHRVERAAAITPPRGLMRKVVEDSKALQPTDGQVTEEEFPDVFREAIHFLIVKSLFPENHSFLPSRKVEKVIKHFVTYTADYRNACILICKRFIDHTPTNESIHGSARQCLVMYGITREIMTKFYGRLDESVWPESSDNLHSWTLKDLKQILVRMRLMNKTAVVS